MSSIVKNQRYSNESFLGKKWSWEGQNEPWMFGQNDRKDVKWTFISINKSLRISHYILNLPNICSKCIIKPCHFVVLLVACIYGQKTHSEIERNWPKIVWRGIIKILPVLTELFLHFCYSLLLYSTFVFQKWIIFISYYSVCSWNQYRYPCHWIYRYRGFKIK